MHDYSHIITGMTSSPWMITESAMKMICEIVESHVTGKLSQEDIRIRYQEARQERNGNHSHQNVRGVGVLQIAGPIFPKANLMTEMSGATSVEQFRQDFRALMADKSVDAILLDIDSPGGHSAQIAEMAAEIREARESKPIWAIANTSATSAAYFLGSAADKLFASPSSLVANVGTIMVYRDDSKKQEMFGIVETPVASSDLKKVGYGPLNDEQYNYLQGIVDDINADFISGVALGRGMSEEEVHTNLGDAAVLTPRQAMEKNAIDGIATFDEVVSEMVTPTGQFTMSNTNYVKQDDALDKDHGEPGPDGEPIPRESPNKDDKAIKGGWRRDTPPPQPEQTATTNEGSAMSREQLETLATALGVEFDSELNDADLSTKVLEASQEALSPILEITQDARDFAKDYPDKARELADLKQSDRESAANRFAAQFSRFESDEDLLKGRGYSSLMCTKIEEAHIKIAARTFTHENLGELLNTAAKSVVNFKEDGSSRDKERIAISANATVREVRVQMATLVKEIMEQDGLERKAAMKVAGEREPELAEAYLNRR